MIDVKTLRNEAKHLCVEEDRIVIIFL